MYTVLLTWLNEKVKLYDSPVTLPVVLWPDPNRCLATPQPATPCQADRKIRKARLLCDGIAPPEPQLAQGGSVVQRTVSTSSRSADEEHLGYLLQIDPRRKTTHVTDDEQ